MRSRAMYNGMLIALASVWLGALATTALAAAVLFPMIKGMGVTAGEYTGYSGEHWRLVAGRPANLVFVVTTIAGSVFAAGGIPCVILATMRRQGLLVNLRRLSWIGCVLVWLGYAGVLVPMMQRSFSDFRDAASAGDSRAADGYSERFRAMHPWASRVLAVEALLLGATVILSILDVPTRAEEGGG